MSKSTRAERAKQDVESEQAPAEQIEDFSSLDVTQISVNTFAVGNRASGTVNTVDLSDRSCTCEDMEYNAEGNEACKHLLYAIYHAPKARDMDNELLRDATTLFSDARDAVKTVAAVSRAPSAPSEPEADETATDGRTDDGEKPPANPEHDAEKAQAEAEAAADKLQAAFDEHIEDMQVRADAGLVWLQTGRDTPDDWPYPGVEETFQAITSPECLMYIHEDHEHFNDKPGEWWKNALYPSDVDEYISEVLE